MWRVIHAFADLQDDNRMYDIGDAYPRAGLSVSDARIAELSGIRNRQRTPLIEEVQEPVKEEAVKEVYKKPKGKKKDD